MGNSERGEVGMGLPKLCELAGRHCCYCWWYNRRGHFEELGRWL